MKYRTDYVTNSSSSSFICAFKNKKDFERQMEGLSNKIGPEYLGRIYRDICDSKITKRQALKSIHDYIENSVICRQLYYDKHDYWSNLCKEHNLTYSNCMDLPEFKALVKEETKKRYDEVVAKFPERGIYSEVEYCDGEGLTSSELEHYVMPNLPFVIFTENHH